MRMLIGLVAALSLFMSAIPAGAQPLRTQTVNLDDIAALQAETWSDARAPGVVIIADKDAGGIFQRVDDATEGDGVDVIATASGRKYQRQALALSSLARRIPNARAASTIIISSDSITLSRASHVLAAEAGTEDDVCNVLTPGFDPGNFVFVRPEAGDSITIKHGGACNIETQSGADIILTGVEEARLTVNQAGDGVTASAGAGGGGGAVADDFTALKAVSPAQAALVKSIVAPGGRGGNFVWDASDLSASCAADPAEAFYIKPGAAADCAGGAWRRVYAGLPDIRWFGVTTDDATDDTAAFQAFLEYGIEATAPRGVISLDCVQWRSGAKLRGAGMVFWSYPQNKPGDDEATWLRYSGAGGAESCVVNASAAAVGTPVGSTSDESNDLYQWGMTNLLIDGLDLADIGLYAVRSGVSVELDRVGVTGTLERGFYFTAMWTCNIGSLYAIINQGTGIDIGSDYLIDSAVNACHFQHLEAFKSGTDGTYDEVANPEHGVGVILSMEKTNVFPMIVAEVNDGPGLYVRPKGGPNWIGGVHLEFNGVYDPADPVGRDFDLDGASAIAEGRMSDDWQIIGYATQESTQLTFQQIFAGVGGSALVPKIWLTGEKTGGIAEGPFLGWYFESLFGVDAIVAEWSKYAVSRSETTLTDANAALPDLLGHLPILGETGSLECSPTTLYVAAAKTGTGSGRDAANRALFDDALDAMRVCRNVSTISVSGSVAPGAIDLRRLSQTAVTIDLETTGTLSQGGSTNVIDIAGAGQLLTIEDFAGGNVEALSIAGDITVRINGSMTSGHASGAAAFLLTTDDGSRAELFGNINGNGARLFRADHGGTIWMNGGSASNYSQGATVLNDGAVIYNGSRWSSTADFLQGANVPIAASLDGRIEFKDDTLDATTGRWRSNIIDHSGAAIVHTGTTDGTIVKAITLPDGYLGANGRARFTSLISADAGNSGNATVRVRLGGTHFVSRAIDPGNSFNVNTLFSNRNSESAQVGGPENGDMAESSAAVRTAAIDTSVDADVEIFVTLANAADTVTVESYMLEAFPRD